MIPLVDLRSQYASIKHDIDTAIQRVLDTGQYVLGPDVEAFEREFAEFCQAAEAVAVNTGTSALHLALVAAGVGPGDEVITVPHTFVATVSAVTYTGARPVFVDIDPATFTMDPRRLESAITPRTRAIIPVHLYGQAADMDPILEIAAAHELIAIEDACQAHGARYKGRPVGTLGHAGCFSFYPGKNLGAYGEGGMLVTNDPAMARDARMRRDWGQDRKYHHAVRGFNYRMEGLQGAILRVKLRRLGEWTEARRARAAIYDALLAESGLMTPREAPHAWHVYHLYVVRSPDRDALARTLHAHGVATGIHYPTPVHLQPAFADLGYGPGAFPESERAAREVLSLPMYPELSHTDIELVAAAVRQESYVI